MRTFATHQEGVEISAISGGSVTLSNGCVIDDVDAVLLGTGYGGPKYHRNLDMHDDTPFWCKVCGAQAVFSRSLGEKGEKACRCTRPFSR